MSGRPLRFSLVSSTHVSNNPRLVKEADALSEAGHVVRVVAVSERSDERRRDAELVADRSWTLECVDARPDAGAMSRARWVTAGARQAAAGWLYARGMRAAVVRDGAASRHAARLARLATARPADVVIGHTLQALPAAACAARQLDARLGFDAEDLHAGELPPGHDGASRARLIAEVERDYLRRCDSLTASSEGIAEELVRCYGVRKPCVVLNCFPLLPRRAVDAARARRRGARPSLYWFSQVIGPHRGLEEVVRALGTMRAKPDLILRGAVSVDYRRHLEQLAQARDVRNRLHLLPTAAPGELVELAAEYDVGLAPEPGFSRNNLLAASNKLFTYLAAGMAVVASDTPGQYSALAEAPGAARFYKRGDADDLARVLDELLDSSEALAEAKRRAWQAAADRYSWERESRRLVEYLTGSAPAPEPAVAW